MSMTTEQQEELLLGLRTEVLEIKEMLADEYYNKNQLSSFYITFDNLNEKLNDYITDENISKKYETIRDSDNKDIELGKLINNCATKSQLEDFVKSDLFNESIKNIDDNINSVKQSVSNNNDLINNVYTKNEIDEKGYLTSHQSLDNIASIEWIESKGYLTEHQDLSAYATKNWVNSQIDGKEINLSGYAKITDIPKKVSELDNDLGYLTSHQSLSDYVTKNEINSIYTNLESIKNRFNNIYNNGYITISDVASYINMLNLDDKYALLDDIPSLDNYTTKQELEDVNYNIISLSNKINKCTTIRDVSEYITSLGFDDKYAKKTDVPSLSQYAKKTYIIENYARISDIPNISNIYKINEVDEIFETKEDINNKLTKLVNIDDYKEFKEDTENTLSSLVNKNELKLYCEQRFVNKSDFNSCLLNVDEIEKSVSSIKLSLISNYVTNKTLKNNLSSYATLDDLNGVIEYMITESDINSIINNKMNVYVDKTTLNNSIDDIESTFNTHIFNSNSRLTNIENSLSDFVNKDDLNKLYDKFVNKDILDDYVLKSELISFYNEKTSLYATKNDIRGFITLSDVDENYISKNTINSYIPDLSSYVTKASLKSINSNIEILSTNILDSTGRIEILNQKLSNYYNKTEIDSKLSELKVSESVLDNYVKKVDLPKSVDLSSYALTSDVQGILNSLNKYAKITDLPNTNDFISISKYYSDLKDVYDYIDNNVDIDSKLYQYETISDVDDKIASITKSYISEAAVDKKLEVYLKKAELYTYIDNYVKDKLDNITKKYVDERMDNYLTKNEASCTYLALEDYKYLKSAAVLNASYRDERDTFFNSLFDENGFLKNGKTLHNGFYIVGDELLLVYNGEIIEFENIEYWKEEEK